MASAAVILGSLGAGFAGLTALRLLRGGAKGADKFVRGGFKGKMDRSEAIQILGLRWVDLDVKLHNGRAVWLMFLEILLLQIG